MKNAVTNGFDRMSPSALIAKAHFIVNSMAANTEDFPAPQPTLSYLTNEIEAFARAAQAAENGDRVAAAYKNDLKALLVLSMRQLGSYVNNRANGNRHIALSAGFDVTKERTPIPPITHVPAPVLTSGSNAGEIKSRIKAIKGATIYQYYIHTNAEAPLSEWTMITTTYSRFTFEHLQSGTRYYIKVTAIGVRNQAVCSGASSYIPQ